MKSYLKTKKRVNAALSAFALVASGCAQQHQIKNPQDSFFNQREINSIIRSVEKETDVTFEESQGSTLVCALKSISNQDAAILSSVKNVADGNLTLKTDDITQPEFWDELSIAIDDSAILSYQSELASVVLNNMAQKIEQCDFSSMDGIVTANFSNLTKEKIGVKEFLPKLSNGD